MLHIRCERLQRPSEAGVSDGSTDTLDGRRSYPATRPDIPRRQAPKTSPEVPTGDTQDENPNEMHEKGADDRGFLLPFLSERLTEQGKFVFGTAERHQSSGTVLLRRSARTLTRQSRRSRPEVPRGRYCAGPSSRTPRRAL